MALLMDSPALAAYESLAAHYDAFTAAHDHRTWLTRLERLARDHGLAGRRVIDLACGTGKSLAPLLELGYEGAGCDLSPGMLAHARRRLPGVWLCEADLRDLPPIGSFDWVTCLDDALNYLLGDEDLAAALGGMARLLAPDGVVTFDLNTLAAHREGFAATWVVEDDDRYLCWQGRGCGAGPGEPGHADIDAFTRDGDRWQRPARSTHRQRWWSAGDVTAAAAVAGLQVVAARGQSTGAVLHERPDEVRCTKTVFVLRHAEGGAA
jgi:SAM-dependent methyltransferase